MKPILNKAVKLFFSYNLIRINIARSAITGDILKHVISELLEAMATIGIGRQKRKNQPRAIKRRPKAYPLLTVTREEACEAIN